MYKRIVSMVALFAMPFSIVGAAYEGELLHPTFTLWHTGKVKKCEFNKSGTQVVTVDRHQFLGYPWSHSNIAYIWDAQNSNRVMHTLEHSLLINSVKFNQAGTQVVTASMDKTACIWDTQDGKKLLTLQHDGSVNSARFNQAGTQVATVSGKDALIWDAQEGTLLRTLQHNAGILRSAVFNQTGTLIATASSDNAVRIWSALNGELIYTLQHDRDVLSAIFNRAGTQVVTQSISIAKIWDMNNGQLLHTLKHEGPVSSVAFNQSDTQIVTGSWKNAYIWDASSGRLIHTLPHSGCEINSAAFNQDGTMVVTAGDDKTARVWNAHNGQELCVLKHRFRVNSAAFNQSGMQVVTASDDGTASIWSMPIIAIDIPENIAQVTGLHKVIFKINDNEPVAYATYKELIEEGAEVKQFVVTFTYVGNKWVPRLYTRASFDGFAQSQEHLQDPVSRQDILYYFHVNNP